jgi:hypothetical protein
MVSLIKRVLSVCAAVALVVTGAVAFAGTASALIAPACPSYGTPAQSQTEVSVEGADGQSADELEPGDTFTATATVTVDGQPATGDVVFNYRGTKSVASLDGGTATSGEFTVKKGANQTVRANYRGSCTNGSASVAASESGAQILGVEAFAGGGNNNGTGAAGQNGNGGGTLGAAGTNAGGGAVGGLAATGLSPAAQLIGLTGVALLVAGASTLVIRRRRVTVI